MLVRQRVPRMLWLLLLVVRPSLTTSSAAASSSTVTSSTSTSAATCIAETHIPVHYAIRNVTLSDSTLRRGVAVSIGTPAQPFAFVVNPNYNNTFLNDGTDNNCNVNLTRLQCSNQQGGLFDEGSSSSWSSANYYALGTASEDTSDQHQDVWGSDTVVVNTTLSLTTFPLGIVRASEDPSSSMNVLGLGRNSTLLSGLISAGAIASRTYGLFQGWTGGEPQWQTDGSLTLGGYDAAKVTGNNITLPMSPEGDCNSGYIVSVTDIKMNLKNGSNVSILGQSAGSAMRACIEPGFNPISLSEDIWWAFTNVTGVEEEFRSTSPLEWWGMMIPADGAYDGDLTISLYPGLDVTIPNHQLIVPDIEINSVGQEYPSTNESVEVLINSLQGVNTNDMPRLGMPFLSSAYLLANNDQQQFTLWQSKQSQTSNLIAIGPPACNTPIPTPTPKPLSSVLASPPPPSSKPQASRGAPKGAIAGAVIGGIAAAALCLGAFLLRRRRRAHRVQEAQRKEYEARTEAVKDSVYSDSSWTNKPEMPSDRQPPQEMPLVQNTGYSVAPYEIAEQTHHEMMAEPKAEQTHYEMPATPRFRR